MMPEEFILIYIGGDGIFYAYHWNELQNKHVDIGNSPKFLDLMEMVITYSAENSVNPMMIFFSPDGEINFPLSSLQIWGRSFGIQ